MDPSNHQPYAITISRALLACGGLALALFGDLWPDSQLDNSDQSNPVAVVNQRPIALEDANISSQRLWQLDFHQLSTEQQQSVIQVLIDEELLLQRAESLELVSTDPGLRKAAVAAAIDLVVTDYLAQPYTEQELQQFFLDQRGVFEISEKLAVDALLISSSVATASIETLLAAGHSLNEIAQRVDSQYLLPRSLMPAHRLQSQLGATAAAMVLQLPPGEISAPLQRPEGLVIFQVTQKQPSLLPDYWSIRDSVVSEYQRRGREQALQRKLAQLWQSADISIAGGQ
ncbi:MAG: peptidyl-prolyl cis-trans isomerase [Porticoccaceae bacterium]